MGALDDTAVLVECDGTARIAQGACSHKGFLSMSLKMWAAVAAGGRLRNGNLAVWVDRMTWPLATCTSIGVTAGWTFVRKDSEAKKCPVLPESRTMGGEGPSVAVMACCECTCGSLWVLGVPRS